MTGPRFSPYDYQIHSDPYPVYARLRDEAPLYRNDELDFWALSRHEDVAAAFRDLDRLSNANGVSLEPSAWGRHAHRTMSFLALDPPRHTRMRALVSRSFTPRRVRDLEQVVTSLSYEVDGATHELDPASDGMKRRMERATSGERLPGHNPIGAGPAALW